MNKQTVVDTIGAPLKPIVILMLTAALTACGVDPEPAVSETKSALPGSDFVMACSAEESFATTVQSIRATMKDGGATLVIDRFDGSIVFTATDSLILSNQESAFSASWTDGPVFAVTQERGRVFTGAVTLADQTVIGVRCVRIVTSDRDADEFSLVCALTEPATAGASELPDVPATLLLNYEEGELEMFVNPASAIEIFDLELASDVTVTNSVISGKWDFHKTAFTAAQIAGEKFAGTLNYRGLATFDFVCHKI